MEFLIYYSKIVENGEIVSQTQSQDNSTRVSWNTQDAKSADYNSMDESYYIIKSLFQNGWNGEGISLTSPP